MNAAFFKFSNNKNAAPSAASEDAPNSLFHAVDPASFTKPHMEAERLFGLENFGNTCYANSVVQALFFCGPFRNYVVSAYPNTPIAAVLSVHNLKEAQASQGTHANGQRKNSLHGNPLHPMPAPSTPAAPDSSQQQSEAPPADGAAAQQQHGQQGPPLPPLEFKPSTMLTTLRDLFVGMALHQDKTGVIAPEAFITQLRRENEFFRSSAHQDAHEFLNYLLNIIADEAEREIKAGQKALEQQESQHKGSETGKSYEHKRQSLMQKVSSLSWVHQLFQGTLTNETLCLNCKNISSRDETFLDLSLDIEENSSITSCLRQFSASELLVNKNKFSCDPCGSLQDAERRMKIKHSPDVLSLHLKRFKWQEDVGKFTKLSYRVVFPFELRLFNTVDDSPDLDRLYHLWAIVVHVGAGPYHGHYVTIVKSMGRWLLFDDENITQINEADISNYYGGDNQQGCGYVLFYQAADITSPPPLVNGYQSTNGTEASQSEGEEIEQLDNDVVAPLSSSIHEDTSRLHKSKTAVESPQARKSFMGIPKLRRSTSSKPDTGRPFTAPDPSSHSEMASLSSSADLSDSSSSSNIHALRNGAPSMKLDLTNQTPIIEPTPPSPSQPADRRSWSGRLFSRKSVRRRSHGTPTTPTTEQANMFEAGDLFQRQQPQQQGPAASDMPSLGYVPLSEGQNGSPDSNDHSSRFASVTLGKKERKQTKQQDKKDESKQRSKGESKRQRKETSLKHAGTSSSDQS